MCGDMVKQANIISNVCLQFVFCGSNRKASRAGRGARKVFEGSLVVRNSENLQSDPYRSFLKPKPQNPKARSRLEKREQQMKAATCVLRASDVSLEP